MWRGCRMMLLGITPQRAQILSKRIEEHGGKLYAPPPKLASIFAPSKRKRGELPADLTHIICEEKYNHAHGSRILTDIDTTSIPDSVQVVQAQWVIDCGKKSLLPTEPYIIATAAKINEEAAAAAASSSASSSSASQQQQEGEEGRPSKVQAVGDSADVGEWQVMGQPASAHALKPPGCLSSPRVVAFDLDSTLVTTKSGKGFPKEPSDWKWMYPTVPTKLRQLHAEGYKVVIISNQLGVAKGKLKVEEMRGRVSQVVSKLGIPVEAFCATGDDIYRKPRIGIWQLLSKTNPTDNSKSLFVGDAAGRPALGSRKKDFSASDVMFAVNAGIDFQTPEEFFLGAIDKIHSGAERKKAFSAGPLDAYVHSSDHQAASAVSDTSGSSGAASSAASIEQEAVLLIGPAGVGKTTYCKTVLPNHEWINQDTLKRREKCLELARTTLRSGKSVVIDATNRDRIGRKEWVSLFRLAMGGKGKICFVAFAFPAPVALHLNAFRGINPSSEDRRRVPDPVIYKTIKDMESVAKDEGYDELVVVNKIVPGPFKNGEEEALFFMHLLG